MGGASGKPRSEGKSAFREIHAKQKGMKRNLIKPGQDDFFRAPAHPLTGPRLFRRFRAALTDAFGAEPSYHELGILTGQASSTTQHWFQVFDHRHLFFFLCLLEQLPPSKRMELLNEFCRELPSLHHPRLAHDPVAVAALENLLGEKHGITVISGGSDFQRMFLATALGHSFKRKIGLPAKVAGLDVHQPQKMVPLAGLVYFREPLPVARLRLLAHEAWPEISSSTAQLFLFDGIWSAVPDLRDQIIELGGTRHVVIADADGPDPTGLARATGNRINVITIDYAKENPAWIRLRVVAV
jgi:hypothetical protein